MSRLLPPEPLLKTPVDDWNANERLKVDAGLTGGLVEDFRDLERDDIAHETETLAKSHGIYAEYNRAKTGKQKDWMYMVRISVPGGGAFGRDQWRVIDEISRRFTTSPENRPSIRLTTRQNIQFHWISKADLIPAVKMIAESGFFALNGCGDNVRNVMACPLSKFGGVTDAWQQARKYGTYFQLAEQPHLKIFAIDTAYDRAAAEAAHGSPGRFGYGKALLNRKFKIAFGAAHPNPQTGEIELDNCVELRTNDLGASPIIEHGRHVAWQLYVGGGQGEKNGKSSFSTLGLPLGVFTPGELHGGMDAVVKVHQEYGDRKNRHWARLKYVVHKQGIDWFRDEVRKAGASFSPAIEGHDVGPRQMHHGWQDQGDGKLAYGLWVENGRLIDREELQGAASDGMGSTVGNGERLQALVRHLMENFDTELMITPNQDLLFTNLDPAAKDDFEAALPGFKYGVRGGKRVSRLRTLSGACVGLPTCRLSYTDSEQFEPELIGQLEAMGYGDFHESIGVTGCERQCFRPATKSIGWVGQGPGMYMLKIGGDEAGRHQGTPLVENDNLYLRQVPRDHVATVTATLFDHWQNHREADEDLGTFHRRLGHAAILAHLRDHPATAKLTEKAAPASYEPTQNTAA